MGGAGAPDANGAFGPEVVAAGFMPPGLGAFVRIEAAPNGDMIARLVPGAGVEDGIGPRAGGASGAGEDTGDIGRAAPDPGLWSQTKDLFLCRRVYLTGPPTAQAGESRCPTDLAQRVVDVHRQPHW